MKKLASLVLALALVLTAVCAFAEVKSPLVDNMKIVATEGGEAEILPTDDDVQAEIARIIDAVAEGTEVSDLFGEEAAVTLEGATDVLAVVKFQLEETDKEEVYVTFENLGIPFQGNVQCLIGVKNEAGVYEYTPVPTTVNNDGTVTILLKDEMLAAAIAAPVLGGFVQL